MSDQEWMVRLQFLEEAQEYLDEMESALLGLGSQKLAREALDRILRAAHSIKGGSALMGFEALSQVAHRLEDFFKVLQGGRYEPSAGLERLFLGTVDQMRQQVGCDRQRDRSNSAAIARQAQGLLNQLYDILGDPTPEDEQASLSVDAGGEDMAVLMFEGEIGPCLDRLQGVLADPDLPLLRQEFLIACPEMGSLGEMLDLGQFSQLCNHGEALVRDCHEAELMAVCEAVLKALRRSHGLVLVGQAGLIPETVSWPSESQAAGLPERLDLEEGWASPDVPEIAPAALPESISQDSLGERDSQQPTALELALEALFSDGFGLDGQELAHQPSPTALEPLDSPLVSDAEIGPEIWPEIQPAPAPAAIAEPPSPAIPEEAGDALAPPASSQHQPDPDLQSGSSKDATVRVSLRKLERLGELLGELTTERNSLGLQLNYLTSLFALLGDRVHSLDRANGLLRQSYDRSATEQVAIANSAEAAIAPDPAIAQNLARFDRLEMDHYGNLHLVAQEIIESVVQIQEVTSDLELALGETTSLSRELNRTTQQLQVGMNQMRMRPLSAITDRFPRLLRELSLAHGKQVGLRLRGNNTLIERSIIEALQDPLMHLLRNSFDHGIESPVQRLAAGKPAQGKIEISAGYRGNQVVITLGDDGGGIDLDKIRRKVMAMGLSPAEIEASGEQELLNLIFEPGFSTADQVTALSGRGVGMDVVRSNLQAVGGNIAIQTQPGQGTTFVITVPLSLSVTRVLVVECQGMVMAIPTSIVEEMLLLQPEQVFRAAEQELIEWQGYTLPLLHLQDWLQFTRPQIPIASERRPIIDQASALVVTYEGEPYGIACDRYWGEQEATTRTVEGTIKLPQGFSGCIVLGDGRVVPLVEIDRLVAWILNDAQRQVQAPQPLSIDQLAAEKPMILIVDDSINVRRFLAITLEKAGYTVEQARDGQEAIDKLRGGIRPSAIMSDVEMPRLDGFGFLAQVKSLAPCSEIPVVMLTSRSGDKHRQLAFSLGAADYFSKPFKQNELLASLSQLTETQTPVLASV